MHLKRALDRLRGLPRARRGVAVLEFALGLPLVLAVGGYGVELGNYAIVQQRVNQTALQLADNASRVGLTISAHDYQLREVDVNDVLQGVRLTGSSIYLTTFGRITLSSLEYVNQTYDAAPVQRIHWQRCIGLKQGLGWDSTYGKTSPSAGSDATLANAGTAMPTGMGDAGAKVNAPLNTGVMFVEVNYQYQPIFGTLFMDPVMIHYIASFIVRDDREFKQIFPTTGVTASTCDKAIV